MSNLVETIAGAAMGALMILVLLLVLATLVGGDPNTFADFFTAGVRVIVYLMIVALFGAIIIAVISEVLS